MSQAARRSFLGEHLGDLGFSAVVIAAYLSAMIAMAYLRPPLTQTQAMVLVMASIAYLILGVAGFAYAKRAGSLPAAVIYLVIQLSLAATILYLSRSRGLIWLIVLPLASQSVVLLPRPGMLAMCGVIVLLMMAPIILAGAGWLPAFVIGGVYSAGIVFVVVFTQIAMNERKARAEVERLATELGEANAKLRQYAAQIEELATTKERNRLAREIHDSLGHYLTVINVQLEASRAVMETDRRRALDALSKAQSLAQEGLAEVRCSVAALRAPPTENRSLAEAINLLVEECRAAGIATEFTIAGTPRLLAPQTELTLYRAVQEGLTNVRKHARAAQTQLTLDYSRARHVQLSVRDDGVGARETNSGFGLLGLRERAQLLGGQLRIQTSPEQGFTLEVELPG
jgi:signal transduction histidine kinase